MQLYAREHLLRFPRVHVPEPTYWVYILASQSRVLYIGVTNDIVRRIDAHRQGRVPGFTQRYRVRRLVHLEPYGDVRAAIAREKQLKGWRRSKKVSLIESVNPDWRDLWESRGWLLLR